MKNKKKYILSFIFFIIIFILTFLAIFKDNNIGQIINMLKTIDKKYVILGTSMGIIFFVIQGYYIKLILKYLDKHISFIKGAVYACIEFYFSGITPSSTGGQPVQVYYMKKDGIPAGKSSIVVLLTTIIYKLVLMILGITALLFKTDLILNNGSMFNAILFLGIILEVVIILACIIFMFSNNLANKLGNGIIKILEKIKILKNKEKVVNRFKKFIEDYKVGAKYIKTNIWLAIRVTFLTMIQRLAIFTIGYFVYRALGQNFYTYFDIIFIQVVITIATDFLPFPGGIGISEAILMMFYDKMFGPNIAISAMLITRALSFYFIFILSGIVTFINHVLIKKKPI